MQTLSSDFTLHSSHLIPCLPRCQLSSSWLFSCQVLSSNDVYYKSLQKLVPSTNLYYKACTRHVPVLLCTTKLAQTTSQYYFVLQSLHKALRSTTLYYNLAQTTSQYYFVLQSLHKALRSTTLYYKACIKHFPILLCTTQLAQSTPPYYFELQKLHKTTPSTTLYYKACTNYFPILLCTTKTKHSAVLLCTTRLAQNTSQYYFVLQSLHKPLPSTTLYYKACTKHSPVLLCTAKLAQSTAQ